MVFKFSDETSTNLCDYTSMALLVSMPFVLGIAYERTYFNVAYLSLGAMNSRFTLLYNSSIR